MTTRSLTATTEVLPRSQTERAVHDFTLNAVSRLLDVLKNVEPEFEVSTRWERGANGHFGVRTARSRKLWPMLNDEWLGALPEFQTCVASLNSDLTIGTHLDRMVGTNMSSSGRNANDILKSFVYAMCDHQGNVEFTSERFDIRWRDLVAFCSTDKIACKLVAPLPNLIIPTFPLRLNKELVLDRLTDDEVTRCNDVGLILPISTQFPLIYDTDAVGIRRTRWLPKLIRRRDEPHEIPDVGEEGSFGDRPLFQELLAVDDVLSALRLFKQTKIQSAGVAFWVDAPELNNGTNCQMQAHWPFGGAFELAEGEIQLFLDLWRLLESGAARFAFSIRRFNLAFGRRLLDDRIVDLVIAAEALFLSDLDEKYRGELRYRFALRAAKFITHPTYSERDIFRIARSAYDARSAVVHGGSPKDTRLPDNPSANLSAFIDTLEELVRLGLHKALSMGKEGKKMRQAEYWDALVLSTPKSP